MKYSKKFLLINYDHSILLILLGILFNRLLSVFYAYIENLICSIENNTFECQILVLNKVHFIPSSKQEI